MIPDQVVGLRGERILMYGPATALSGEHQGALDIIGNALRRSTRSVVLPVQGITAEFFGLKSGLAGRVLQNFANYQLPLAMVGDVSTRITSLREYIYKANLSKQIGFLFNRQDLEPGLKSS